MASSPSPLAAETWASTIGLDIAKNVFQPHGADEVGRAAFSKRISRAKLLGMCRCENGSG